MRHASILCAALLFLSPASPFGDGDGTAHAQTRKSKKDANAQKKKSNAQPASAKKPVIKLQQETAAQPEPSATPVGAPTQRGPTRIDFDDRLVQGQTNRAGSVYLYDRKELKTEPMVRKRQSFRQEIIESVYDAEQGAP